MFCLPGMWEQWMGPQGNQIRSFAVIMGPPSMVGGQIHNRQPTILPDEYLDAWLDIRVAGEEALRLLVAEQGELEAYPVLREVGNSRIDKPE